MTETRSLKKAHLAAIAAGVLVFCAIIFYSVQLGTNDEVRSAVMTALIDDPEIDASQFEVSVSNGIATIRGTIEDEDMRQLVIEHVKQAEGVIRVIDEIVVLVPGKRTDTN